MKTEKEILEKLLESLKSMVRYEYRVCDDGDGHIDAGEEEASDGPFVLYKDILGLVESTKKEMEK
jgi:hypothetical protein